MVTGIGDTPSCVKLCPPKGKWPVCRMANPALILGIHHNVYFVMVDYNNQLCLKFLAVPESLAAAFCVGETSGCGSLEDNGMGRGKGKSTKADDAEGKMPKNLEQTCFYPPLTKVFTSV